MISGHLFRIRQVARLLWVRAALISALAFVAPLVAKALAPLMPDWVLANMNQDTVRSLLDILANSMLAVTTFSLTIMVTAHLAADRGASPRGNRLLRQDGRTQTVLATFVGSFVYALVSIVLLQTGMVGEQSLSGIYLMTLVVIGLVILTILRWIGQLDALGSIEGTMKSAEKSARDAIETRQQSPFLGGRRLVPGTVPNAADALLAKASGYVRHVDTDAMSELAQEVGATIFVRAVPGRFIGYGETLAKVAGADLMDDLEESLRDCFTIHAERSFEQDPIFALLVLTEIADRALSPGINDPGTARDVIARLTLILQDFEGESDPDEPAAPYVHVPELALDDLMREIFDPIAREGRSLLEVQLDLQKAIAILARHPNTALADAAREMSQRALAYARMGLALDGDIDRVRAAAPADHSAPPSMSETVRRQT